MMSEAIVISSKHTKWIIATKLACPRLPEWYIEREQALEKLDRVLGCRLGFIHAPAGYGKTTLLSQWFKRNSNRDFATAWLTLDEDDREPGVFVAYLAASLRAANIPVAGLNNVISDGFTGISPKSVVATLVNDLGNLNRHTVIILDDYHRIQNDEISELLTKFITHMPDRCHLIIAGRENSDLKLAGISASGQMVTLDADDLRFSSLETQAFYHGSKKINISDFNAELLAKRTEGWVLALQLAGMYFENKQVSSELINKFSGRTVEVADYLAEQVMLGLPSHIQSFLMETSILERFNGDLANAIRGKTNSWHVIAELEQRNLFLVCLDFERRWFRYHHLFSEFLRQRLKRFEVEKIKQLHRAAAEWFIHREQLAEGVRHALLAQDYEYTADIIDKAGGWKLVLTGHIAIVRKVCEAIPDEVIQSHPRVWLGIIFLQAKAGNISRARRMFNELKESFFTGIAVNTELSAECQVIDILISGYEDRPITSREISTLENMVTHTASHEQLVLAMLTNYLCLIYLDICRFDDSIEAGRQSIKHFRASGNRHAEKTIQTHIAQAHLAKGLMNASYAINKTIYDEAQFSYGTDDLGDVAPITGTLLAEIAFERNDLELAADLLDKSLPYIEQFDGWFDIYASAYLTAASLASVTRGIDVAMSILEHAEETAVRRRLERLTHLVKIHQVRELTLAGRVAEAATLLTDLDESGPKIKQPVSRRMSWRVNEAEGICRARLEIHNGEPGRALEILAALHDEAVAGNWNRQLIKTLNLMAIAHEELSERQKALELLERSLLLAGSEGFIRSFLDEGEVIIRLLKITLQKRPPVPREANNFVKLLLSSDERTENTKFSERECQVLKLLGAGFSTKEMAQELNLSENTIKYHRKNVFKKLGAGNRSQALAAARNLSILS